MLAEVLPFCEKMLSNGLFKIRDFYRNIDGDFTKLIQVIPLDKLCIGYDGVSFYTINKDEAETDGKLVIMWGVFKQTFSEICFIEKKYLPIFEEAEQFSDKEKISVFIEVNRKRNNEKFYIRSVSASGFYWESELRHAKRFRSKKALINSLEQLYELGEFDFYDFNLIIQ